MSTKRKELEEHFWKGIKELAELNIAVKSAGYALSDFINKGGFKSCISCIHFDEQTEQCKLYKQRPPARVIVNACQEYCHEKDIPF